MCLQMKGIAGLRKRKRYGNSSVMLYGRYSHSQNLLCQKTTMRETTMMANTTAAPTIRPLSPPLPSKRRRNACSSVGWWRYHPTQITM